AHDHFSDFLAHPIQLLGGELKRFVRLHALYDSAGLAKRLCALGYALETHFGCAVLTFSIVSRRAAYVSHPPGVKKTGGCLFFQPTQATSSCASSGLRKVLEEVPNQPSMPSPIFFRGHLAPLSRRPYQPENRFSSVSRPFLNVSGAASPFFTRTRIPLTTTIGLARLELRLDYLGGDESCAGAKSGMWLNSGEIEVREGL